MFKVAIIARPDISTGNNKVWLINDEIKNVILKYGGYPMVLIPFCKTFAGKMIDNDFKLFKQQLSMFDGFIFQGGDDYNASDFQIMDYCYQNNIPTLGICLGMQTMGKYLNNQLNNINTNINHNQKDNDYVHLVNIFSNTKLKEIIKEKTIKVNSRHNECLVINNEYISAVASDGVIEAIEDKNKDFFIGVQWHPESMIEYDKVNCRLFEDFFKHVRCKYENRRIIKDYNE